MVDVVELAKAILSVAYHAKGDTEIRVETDDYSEDDIYKLIDTIVGDLEPHKLKMRGVRINYSVYGKLSSSPTYAENGRVRRGIVYVIDDQLDFQKIEITLRHRV
ncbi:MAG: hypothetical protein JWO51_2949 [Rhodospirillales bacterium]|nr:hypothetical protein [Rhodospirillales bacterium]